MFSYECSISGYHFQTPHYYSVFHNSANLQPKRISYNRCGRTIRPLLHLRQLQFPHQRTFYKRIDYPSSDRYKSPLSGPSLSSLASPRNQQTLERIHVPAKRTVKFKMGRLMNETEAKQPECKSIAVTSRRPLPCQNVVGPVPPAFQARCARTKHPQMGLFSAHT